MSGYRHSIIPIIKLVSEFTTSCYNGDIEMVKFWGKYRSNFYTSSLIDLCYNDEQLFHKVCEKGYLHVAKWLYNLHPYILIDHFNSIFNIVYENGYLNMLKWLIKLNPEYIEDKTKLIVPFWESCMSGRLNIAKWIYANSNDVVYSLNNSSFYYTYKRNKMLNVCDKGSLLIIKWLLSIIPAIEDESDIMEIFNQACVSGKMNIAKCILSRYPYINISANNEKTFRLVSSWGQVNIAKWLLKIKPGIDTSAETYDAFYQTCKHGYLEMAKWLLKINPDINIDKMPEYAYELFVIVCRQGHLDTAKWIYDLNPCNIQTNICDVVNYRIANTHVIKWIFEKMPYVYAFKNRCGVVGAFENSCLTGNIELVKMIYEKQPEYISDRSSVTSCAFAWACCSGNMELVKILLEMFNNIDISTKNELPFISACANGHLTIAKYLIEVKPEIDITARDDKAFKKACVNGHLKVSEWLENIFPEKYSIDEELCIESEMEYHDEYGDGNYRNNQGDIVTNYTYKYTILKIINITKTIQEKDIPKQIDNCSVCLDTKSNVYTKCGHLYCEPCISRWLKGHNNCPYCRVVLQEEDMSNIVS